jgi:hypothetical protein
MISEDSFVLGCLNWLEDTLNSQEDENRDFPKCSGVLCVVTREGPNKRNFTRSKGENVACMFRVH